MKAPKLSIAFRANSSSVSTTPPSCPSIARNVLSERTLKDLGSPLAEWITQALLNPGAETVQRNTKSCDTNLLHLCSFLLDFCANSFAMAGSSTKISFPQLTEKA